MVRSANSERCAASTVRQFFNHGHTATHGVSMAEEQALEIIRAKAFDKYEIDRKLDDVNNKPVEHLPSRVMSHWSDKLLK